LARLNPEYAGKLIHIINSSPFFEHMSMQLVSIEVDKALIELEASRSHLQPYGMVHGGVVATLIDTATFWAAFMRIPEDAGMVNIDLKLNYLKSFQEGLLRATGTTIRSGQSISYAEAKIMDSEGELIAHGTSTLMTLAGKGLQADVPKFI
jgi:uncharacterized protein (TIGR00369 family)